MVWVLGLLPRVWVCEVLNHHYKMNNGVVLMCVLSIELVWVEIYGKMEEKPPFLGIFEVWYRYQTVWYQYHIGSGLLVPVPKGW